MKKKFIDTTGNPSYEDYVDYCNANDREPKGENSYDYWDYCSETIAMWSEDFLRNGLSGIVSDHDRPCIITGELGLWDGNHDIIPVKCRDLKTAVRKCVGSNDDYEVEFDNGVINVTGYHHDGTNTFEIRLLSAKGERALANKDTVQGEIKPYMVKKYHLIK